MMATRSGTERLEELSRLLDAEEISVRLERTYPIDRALEVLEESRTGHVRGQTVLLVNQGATNLASSKLKILAEAVGSS